MQYKESCLINEITVYMGNPEWKHHITKHKEYIKNNSLAIKVPDHLFAIYQNRPIVALKEMEEVDNKYIMEVLLVNNVSRVIGFEHYHEYLYVPSIELMESLEQSFTG